MWNASTCVCVFHVTWCKMVKDIDNAQKVKSRVEREIWNSYTTSPTIPSLPWPGFHWVRIHREPSRVLRKSLVVSQRKRRGRDAERRSCQVFPARGSRAARRRGVPKTPAKAVLLNLLANSCTCFEYFQSVIIMSAKKKTKLLSLIKDQGWSETGTSLPLLLLGNGVEGSGSPRKEQSGGHPSFTFAIWILGIFWGKEDYEEIKFSGSHQRRGDARVAMMLVLLLFFRLDWQ